MSDQSRSSRTLLAGKVISNFGQSSIDCVVRRMSDDGAVIEVESVFGVPEQFHLLIPGEGPPRPCKRAWQSGKQIGLTFDAREAVKENDVQTARTDRRSTDSVIRLQMLALRAALDQIEIGVVLLDTNMKSQFINAAFRRMWALPDAVADQNPAFVALMYHGRDTRAYTVADAELDDYVAERVRLVKVGNTDPLDLRQSNGEIIRMQCAALPDGGRMLSYTYVTDIVRHSDELEVLKCALDNVSEGVLLLDAHLDAQFLNRKMRTFWEISEEQAATHPSYKSLLSSARFAIDPKISPEDKSAFFERRLEEIRAGDPTPRDLQTPDGRRIRAHCTVLDGGGRMITYYDVSDLMRHAEQLEILATTDALTGLFNRRHFFEMAKTEWDRFQRYQRPLSMLMIDIDHFKSVNDRYGHAAGDEAIAMVGRCCTEGKRASDFVGRIGGEEFAIVLPETDSAQAEIVADRLCQRIADLELSSHVVHFKITASIGVASASLSMSGFDVLTRSADEALYVAKGLGRNRVIKWCPPDAPRLAAE